MSYNYSYVFAILLSSVNNVRDEGLSPKRLHNLGKVGIHSDALACCKDNSVNIQCNNELSLIQVPYLFFLNF